MAKSARARSTCAAGALSERLRRVSSWRSSAVSGRRGSFRWRDMGHLGARGSPHHYTTSHGRRPTKPLAVRHGPTLDRFVEVLGCEIEVAGAELLNHPRNLVDRCPPARGPPAPPVHDPLCPVRLIGVAQPAKVPLAHPQQLRRLHAAQLPRLMQPNRIDDPGHSDLRQHAIPPVNARTDRVLPNPDISRVTDTARAGK